MDVSIIVPVFNRAISVSRAIDSALSEARLSCEVIVVDDGSTDGTHLTLERFGDRIIVINQENRGVSSARNAGIDRARGKYIKFLDSDDVLIEGGVEALWNYCEGSASDSLIPFGDAVSGGDPSDPRQSYGYSHLPEGLLFRSSLLGGTMSPMLPLFYASTLRAIGGFNESLSFGEDQELAVRLSMMGNTFVRVATPVFEASHSERLRLSKSSDYSKHVKLAEAIELALLDPGIPPPDSRAFARWVWVLGREAARGRAYPEAVTLFKLADRIAGRDARVGSWAMRGAYNFMSPVRVERVLERLKRVAS